EFLVDHRGAGMAGCERRVGSREFFVGERTGLVGFAHRGSISPAPGGGSDSRRRPCPHARRARSPLTPKASAPVAATASAARCREGGCARAAPLRRGGRLRRLPCGARPAGPLL